MGETVKVNISSAKMLGGIGSILVFLLPLIGWILVLISIYQIGNAVKNPKIFKSYMVGFLFVLIGSIISFFILVPSLLSFFSDNGVGFGIAGLGLAFIIAYVCWILSSVYIKRTYELLAEATKENMFKTAGTLFLIGAITTFIFIGYILLFVSNILLIIAFFSAPNEIEVVS